MGKWAVGIRCLAHLPVFSFLIIDSPLVLFWGHVLPVLCWWRCSSALPPWAELARVGSFDGSSAEQVDTGVGLVEHPLPLWPTLLFLGTLELGSNPCLDGVLYSLQAEGIVTCRSILCLQSASSAGFIQHAWGVTCEACQRNAQPGVGSSGENRFYSVAADSGEKDSALFRFVQR